MERTHCVPWNCVTFLGSFLPRCGNRRNLHIAREAPGVRPVQNCATRPQSIAEKDQTETRPPRPPGAVTVRLRVP